MVGLGVLDYDSNSQRDDRRLETETLSADQKLYTGGETRQELERRFGAQNVSNALDKTKRYC